MLMLFATTVCIFGIRMNPTHNESTPITKIVYLPVMEFQPKIAANAAAKGGESKTQTRCVEVAVTPRHLCL